MLFALLLVGATACRDAADDSARETKRRLERRAAARPDKASARIGVIHRLENLDAGEAVRIERNGGVVEITEAHLVVSAVELHACMPGLDDYTSPERGPMLNGLWDLVVSPAHAHVPSSSTRLGTPFVEDLLAEGDRAQIIGAISPPLAAYCRIYAVIAPADDDVANPTSLPVDAIQGTSLLVRGRQRASASDDWRDFELRTDAAMAVELEALDPRSGESPLVLDRPTSSPMLLIDKRIDPTLFEVSPSAPGAAKTILTRLTERFRIHTF